MKIALDLGHGIGVDRGAVGIIEEEKIINEVGYLVYEKLENLGHEVLLVRPRLGITSLLQSLNYRTITSNSFDANLYISIHANAGGGTGCEVYTYGGKKLTEAIRILENLSCLGFKNRGIKDGSSFYVIKYTVAQALLLEICFTDNKKDVDLYNKIGEEAIATAIVDGIDRTGIKIDTDKVEEKDLWIKRLQKEINKQGFGKLVVDGIAGPKTLAACPVVSRGAKGNITKLIQEKLKLDPDGIFGNMTLKAVVDFQKDNNLLTDGIVGRNTWRKLLEY